MRAEPAPALGTEEDVPTPLVARGTAHTASANTATTTKTATAGHKKRLQPSAPGYSAHPLCRATCLHGRSSNPRPVHRASNLAATRYEKLLSKIFGAYWTGLSVHRTSRTRCAQTFAHSDRNIILVTVVVTLGRRWYCRVAS
jgi:hypothetical protein